MNDLPRLLSAFDPAPGIIKEDYGDFVVEELPLYPFGGTGTHTYFLLEKRGLSTLQAVHDVARALGVRRIDVGYAGLKDARAVTRQWMSIEHVEPERVRAVEVPRIRILEVTRHTNKLRLGHLRGNLFSIKVRRTRVDRLEGLREALAVLAARGVPNYFGPQRFGARGDSWEVGRAIVRGRLDEALDVLLGRPDARDRGEIRAAREHYEAGRFEPARGLWPGLFRAERAALRTLATSGAAAADAEALRRRKRRAFLSIDKPLRRLYVSAYQSHLFNRAVAMRLPQGLDRLVEGDLAWRHANGAVFSVLDAAVEQPRADALEISPSGPLFGYRMSRPSGLPGRREAELLESEGLTPESFAAAELRVKGARRPLRFPVGSAAIQLGADDRGEYLALSFSLPRGCYATSLLRELFAAPPDEEECDVSSDGCDES